MSSSVLHSTIYAMLLSGVLLVQAVVPHAIQDLQDLRAVINSAAATIGGLTNSSRDWGFLNPNPGPGGEISTADLVSNVTTSVLRAKYLLDVDKPNWLNASNGTSTTLPIPINDPAVPSKINITTLDGPYVDYITAVPNLATSLTTLGRSWHKEMNRPVWEAIDALQQGMTAFSSSMLAAELIGSQAVLRTIRASSALEDAQQSWSRFLNLPGSSKAGDDDGGGVPGGITAPVRKARRNLAGALARPEPTAGGGHYTHQDLWGKEARAGAMQSREGMGDQRLGGVPRPFVA